MEEQSFAQFVEGLIGVDRDVAIDRAVMWSESVQRDAIGEQRHDGKRIPNLAAEELLRQLKGLCFFLQHGKKPLGMTHTEFTLLRPLVERWIQMGKVQPSHLEIFSPESVS